MKLKSRLMNSQQGGKQTGATFRKYHQNEIYK